MNDPENIIPFGERKKLFDARTAPVGDHGLTAPIEVFEEPNVSRQQAREVAGQLLAIDLCFIKTRENPNGKWITVTAPGQEQYNFRGKTWFQALEAIHAHLVQAIVANPSGAGCDPSEA